MLSLEFEDILKFRLLTDGLSISEGASEAWSEMFLGPMTLAEYATTGGVAIVLPGERYVNAPIAEREDVAELRFEDDQFVIRDERHTIPVRAIPVPAFHGGSQIDKLDGAERPHTAYGVTHTDRCRVSPIAGCAWRCKFCDLPYEFKYRKRHVDNLLAVITAALDDPQAPARHALISGGTPRRGADEAWMDDVFAYLAESSPMPVDVMMSPRRDLTHPEWLQSVGINTLSINLEVSDPNRAKQLAPAKSVLGRDHYLAYIERAVEAFGVGRVQSLLVVGSSIEPEESTLQGVQDLVDRGCIPVISPFRADPATPMRNLPSATFDEVMSVFLATVEICDRTDTGVWPGPRCIPCHHNTVTVADESDFFVDAEANLADSCAA